MRATKHESRRGPIVIGLALLLLVGLLGVSPFAHAEEEQRTFDSPKAAAKALITAAAKNDSDALRALYGPTGADLVQDADDPMVRAERKAFAAAALEMARLRTLEDGSRELVVGRNEWPLPILIVQDGETWRFDCEDGKEEILLRRIGRNELTAIRIATIYPEAQVAYADEDRDGDEVREYAQKILSTPGQQDGLYWETDEESPRLMSPLGPSVISLREHLEADDKKAIPFNGYYWKILKGQGDNAPGGAHSYVINGNMIAGFALVGVPASYRSTGVVTFVVSHHGEIFEKDLGESGIEIVTSMDTFDPDETWKRVEDEDEDEIEEAAE